MPKIQCQWIDEWGHPTWLDLTGADHLISAKALVSTRGYND